MHCGITYRFAAVRALVLAALWLCGSGSLLAQTYTTLFLFGGGGSPRGTLVEGPDGNLYGTTYGYGGRMNGIIFKITPGGTYTALHSGGGTFQAGLTLGADGNFYGTSVAGGPSAHGYVFRITPSGTLTTLSNFGPLPDGYLPETLVQASDGNFYGTTLEGGANGGGMLFRITTSGTRTTIYNFCAQSNCADGTAPLGLIEGRDGNLYGVTGGGGSAGGYGTIFKMTTTGTLTALHSFDLTDGAGPEGLVQASDGNFYGTTNSGGFSNSNCGGGNVPGTCGTVFKITPMGAFTTVHLFNSTDGGNPGAAPIQASDGNLYGTTAAGGTPGSGTIFKITLTGTLTTLYNLNPNKGDGAFPAGLVQHTNGTFYGPTIRGGKVQYHSAPPTVARCSVCRSVWRREPASGNVGAAVNILGTNLTGTTSVSSTGTAATFTVVSSSEITTTVPAGVTTGEVQVVTHSGTLSSNVPFRVPALTPPESGERTRILVAFWPFIGGCHDSLTALQKAERFARC